MSLITLDRPLVGDPLLPRTTHRARSRFGNFLTASGLSGGRDDDVNENVVAGFHWDREAGLVVTITSCDRPLFFAECEALAQFMQMDLVLLRFDPLLGASFDVLMAGSQSWLCDFLAWRREGGDMWLVPARASGPYFCLNERGLEACEGAPFENGSERYAGIIRAIESPSFKGRF
jgi:hypothetical protein